MPRAGLSPELVAAQAARIADEVGFDHLTLARVAERFGVAVPSLYKHVPGLPALRRAVSMLAIRELAEALAPAQERDGRDGLRSLAAAYRGYAKAHPGRYAATLRAPSAEDVEGRAATRAVLDVVFSVLAGYGLTGPDAVDATRALRAGLHGFLALEAVGGFGMPQDVDR